MDFSFTQDQVAIREVVRQFAKERLVPDYQARERGGTIGKELTQEIGKLGFIAPALPENLGGHGLDNVLLFQPPINADGHG